MMAEFNPALNVVLWHERRERNLNEALRNERIMNEKESAPSGGAIKRELRERE